MTEMGYRGSGRGVFTRLHMLNRFRVLGRGSAARRAPLRHPRGRRRAADWGGKDVQSSRPCHKRSRRSPKLLERGLLRHVDGSWRWGCRKRKSREIDNIVQKANGRHDCLASERLLTRVCAMKGFSRQVDRADDRIIHMAAVRERSTTRGRIGRGITGPDDVIAP